MKVAIMAEKNSMGEMREEAIRLIIADYWIVIFYRASSAPKERPRCHMYINEATIQWEDRRWSSRGGETRDIMYYLYLASKEEMLTVIRERWSEIKIEEVK